MKNLILLTAVALASTACSDHDELKVPSDANAITFGTTVQVETKAVVSGTNIPSNEKIGIYALTHASTPAWATENEMDNIEATSNGSGGLDYSPIKTYTENNIYNFYAYYPYTAADPSGDGIKDPTAGTSPKLQVTLAKTPDAQADYMYAEPIVGYVRTEAETTAGNMQKLVFKHALTQVRFKFKNTEESNKVSIVSIKVTDKDKGTMDITNGTWSNTSETADNGNTFTFYQPAGMQEVAEKTSYDVPGQLMLFPKTGSEMAANTTGGLEFVLSLKDHSDADKTVTIVPKVPVGGLEAGKSYLYTLLYSADTKDFISLSTEVVDWVNATGGDLPATPDKP